MTVTITQIAKAAGVSVATVSRALTDSDHPMNEKTRERIVSLAKELGYQPNLVARSLRMDRTHTIGVIVENILSPFIPPIIRGIQDYLIPGNYSSIVMNSDWDPKIEIEAVQTLNKRQIDGILFIETWHRSSDVIQNLTDKPFVFCHRLFNNGCVNSVVPDEVNGSRLAVSHLIRLGHTRIAYINGPKEWDSARNRLLGYQVELEAHQISFEPALVKEGNWEVGSGYKAAQELISSNERPTAIFAANDLMALGAIYALQDAALRVPQDVAVVGYDNRNFAGFIRPALTTVTLPCYEMGQESARLLLSLINGETESVATVSVKGELIQRESCGANPSRWEFEEDQGSKAWRKRWRESSNW
jgi:LacI family transcriptional regulator